MPIMAQASVPQHNRTTRSVGQKSNHMKCFEIVILKQNKFCAVILFGIVNQVNSRVYHLNLATLLPRKCNHIFYIAVIDFDANLCFLFLKLCS